MKREPGETWGFPSEEGDLDEWIAVPLPLPLRHGLVWHYTGVDGLLGIVSNNALWASSPRVLNDVSELEYGAGLFQEAWSALKNEVPEPCAVFVEFLVGSDLLSSVIDSAFILSTSLEGDLLTQWMHYSKSDGFSIALDLSVALWPKVAGPNRTSMVFNGWARVIYDRNSQLEMCTRLLKSMARATPGSPHDWQQHQDRWPRALVSWRIVLGTALMHMKHPAYKDEREVRYICGRGEDTTVKFRASNGRLIPYVEVARDPHPPVNEQEGTEGAEPITLPIKEVRCGPDVRRGTPLLIKSMLASYGYNDVEVRSSDIPYSAV